MCCDASIVVTVFNSCPLCFLFYKLFCDASILVTLQQLPILLSVLLVVIKSCIGTQGVKLAGCTSASPLPPPPTPPTPRPVVHSTDRSKAVVPVLVLHFVVLWFILRGDFFYVLPCVILFLCFSVLLALRLPRLGKRELILVLFVSLFDLRLFGFVCFLFLLVSGLRFVIVSLPGLFSYFFFFYTDL